MIQSWKGVVPQIDPTAFVHPSAVIIGDVVIGAESSVWPCAVLRGDCGPIRVGQHSNIQDGTIVHTTTDFSEAIIGDRVTIGHSAVIHGCQIGNDCLIGMNATLLDNAVLGQRSIVAAGSVVPVGRLFETGGMIMGSPARIARALSHAHIQLIENGWRTYHQFMQEARDGALVTIG